MLEREEILPKGKFNFVLVCVLFLAHFLGCGYSTRTSLPGHFRSIAIESFKNSIDYAAETQRNVYIPLLEVKIRKSIINRYLWDGYFKITDPEKADLVLKGELINFDRSELRTSDNQDVEEYRITVTVSLELKDMVKDQVKWIEPHFSGEATYSLTGSLASSETGAIDKAIDDLARRVIERTVEDW